MLDALGRNKHVTYLDLSSNDIGAAGVEKLVECLRIAESIVSQLSLMYNSVGDAGAKILGTFLQTPTNCLTYLNLGSNGIGDAGGIDLGLMIANAKSLKQADFSCSLAAERTHPLGHAPSPLAIDAH